MSTIEKMPDIDKIPDFWCKNQQLILEWRNYYMRQRIVRTVTNESEVRNACGGLLSEWKEVAFVVFIPITILHVRDFMSGVEGSASSLFFMKDGTVIPHENLDLSILNFSTAFIEIVNRTTGKNLENEIVPKIPKNAIASEEGIAKLQEKAALFEKNIEEWIEMFKKLPAVTYIERYTGEVTDRLIEIALCTCFPEKTDREFYSDYALCMNNVVEFVVWRHEAESTELFDTWEKALDLKTETWQSFYEKVFALSNKYLDIPKPH